MVSVMIAPYALGRRGYQQSPGFSSEGGTLGTPTLPGPSETSGICPVLMVALYSRVPFFHLFLPQEQRSGMARILGFEIRCHPFLTERPWGSVFTSKSLGFLLCSKKGYRTPAVRQAVLWTLRWWPALRFCRYSRDNTRQALGTGWSLSKW